MNTFDKDRIDKFFYNPSKENEDFIVDAYSDDHNIEKLKEIAHDHWVKAASDKIDLRSALNSIHFHINSEHKKISAVTRILSVAYKIAAILFIPILLSGIWLLHENYKTNNLYTEIRAPRGSRVQFTLPDGSIGYLNGGSEIKYNVNFKKNRKIYLQGEGYFDVVKDKAHPFIVQTKNADIEVYGTKFDVCAYLEDHKISTTLKEGKVRVFNKIGKTYAILDPGEQNIICTTDGKMKSSLVKTELYTSWINETLRFDNASFNEVVSKMERWYGVNIMLDKSLRNSERYTFTVKSESLNELLSLLSITTPMNFTIDKDTVRIYHK